MPKLLPEFKKLQQKLLQKLRKSSGKLNLLIMSIKCLDWTLPLRRFPLWSLSLNIVFHQCSPLILHLSNEEHGITIKKCYMWRLWLHILVKDPAKPDPVNLSNFKFTKNKCLSRNTSSIECKLVYLVCVCYNSSIVNSAFLPALSLVWKRST